MKIKTSEATKPQLDWLVAKCEGAHVDINSSADIIARRLRSLTQEEEAALPRPTPYCTIPGVGQAAYSTNWAQGGPIIERHQIAIEHDYNDEWVASYSHPYQAGKLKAYFRQTGPTPLIAAMRCFVASKMGDEVEVPFPVCQHKEELSE